MRIRVDQLPLAMQEQVRKQLQAAPSNRPKEISGLPIREPSGILQSKRLFGSRSRLNKTEAEYLLRLQQLADHQIFIQDVTFRIGIDCRYTPDFFVVVHGRQLQCHEVKGGFVRDDGRVKLMAAARQYPFIQWFLAQKKGGIWAVTQIGG